MGISEEEIAETVQIVSSVSAGVLTSMAIRAQKRSEPKQGETLADLFKG
jgi:hypothetical protein